MIRIRKFLAREGKFLLEEFGAPNAATLLRRAVFWGWFYCNWGIVLGGLVAVYALFGMAAFWAAIGTVYLVYLATLRRTPVYFGDGSEFGLDLGGSAPTLPPGGGGAAAIRHTADRSGEHGSHAAPSGTCRARIEVG